jgi:hypothetical protein
MKPCPKPGAEHSAPFQPSPYESVMSRVHVAPAATANGKLEAYGAPPISVVPSEQLRLQPTSLGYEPPEHVITEDTAGDGEGGGGEGGGGDGEGGGSDGGGGDGEGGGGDGGLSDEGGGCVGGESAEGGKGGGMPTTAISTGSHCGVQASPRAKERDPELGRPMASEKSNPCTMAACVGWLPFS